ncbi:MAG: molybdenum ABC transporter ATP-binding protein [Proteobacteria bacterium]|nr:molybdenum ABC transporter ATP-binding protein [Pseudomonadota bacterium]
MSTPGIRARLQLRYPGSESEFSLDVDTTFPGRGVTAIFGESGSGKTTLLRCVAGLVKADHGLLIVNDLVWQDKSTFVPTHRRPVGYVFQESSLFPHLNARGNLTYAMKRSASSDPQALYDRVMETMDIGHILSRYPGQLSGGERQRIAIARALLIAPRLLLMDEPLASLDEPRKQEILPYLERLHTSLDIPVLYVSHSVDEVARLADTIVVMRGGKIEVQGQATEVFSRIDLQSGFGEETGVVLQGRIVERDQRWHLARVAFAGGGLWVRDSGDPTDEAVRIRVLARDVSIALTSHDDSSILNRLQVEVAEIENDRDHGMFLVRLKAGQEFLIARLTHRSVDHLQLTPGKSVWAQIKSVAIVR